MPVHSLGVSARSARDRFSPTCVSVPPFLRVGLVPCPPSPPNWLWSMLKLTPISHPLILLLQMSFQRFHPAVQQWFTRELGEPTAAQLRGWASIGQGRHTLIAAPTGSGKTLAAFLTALDDLTK